MIPIPEGSEAHSEEPTESDYGSAQESLDQPGPLINSGGDPLLELTRVSEVEKLGRLRGGCELSSVI